MELARRYDVSQGAVYKLLHDARRRLKRFLEEARQTDGHGSSIMSDDAKAPKILRRLLDGTRDEELDCDRFLELLPPYLDGRVGSDQLREQIAHHARQCPECSEELEISKRALGPGA